MKKRKTIVGIACAGVLCAGMLVGGLAACGQGGETLTAQPGESTLLVTHEPPERLTPENAIYAFMQKKSELSSYIIETEVKLAADIGYRQEIHNITYINGKDCFNQAQTDSVIVRMKHQAFTNGGRMVYRNSFEGDLRVAEREDYKQVYGFTADEATLGGYIVNARTLRYAALDHAEGDTLTYYLRLSGDQSLENHSATESATAGMRLQTKAYGSLENLPAISDVDMYVTFKKDWTPVSYTAKSTFVAKKIFDMNVDQTLECTFSKVNEGVEIPHAEEFSAKLGTTPSVVLPTDGEDDPMEELTAALGNTIDGGTVRVPVTVGLNTFAAPISLGGELTARFRQAALSEGDLLDAVTLRLDIDLSAVPLLSGIANTLTVRYPGDGVLLLQLNDRTAGADNVLATYSVGIGERLSPSEGGSGLLDTLGREFEDFVSLETAENGYVLSLKPAAVDKLNEAYSGLLAKVEAKLGGAKDFVHAMLGMTLQSLSVELEGREEVTGLALKAEGVPAENTLTGDKFSLAFDLGLLRSHSLCTGDFRGELSLRLDPSALISGDLLSALTANVHLDVSSAAPICKTLGSLSVLFPDMAPLNGVDPATLDLYLTGDGMLTLALYGRGNEAAPVFVKQVDLQEMLSEFTPAPGGEGSERAPLSPQFTLQSDENGVRLILGDSLVKALDAAYDELTAQLVSYVEQSKGITAGRLLSRYLGAEIQGMELYLGKDAEGNFSLDISVMGTPDGAVRQTSLFSLTLTRLGALDAAEREKLLNNRKIAEQLITGAAKK